MLPALSNRITRALCLLGVFLNGCAVLTTAAIGPHVGFAPGRGVTAGWSATTSTALGASNIGAGPEINFGQTFRRAADPAVPARFGERVTFLDAGLHLTDRDATGAANDSAGGANIGYDTGPALGVAWSSRMEGTSFAADFPASFTLTKGLPAGDNCGSTRTTLVPTFTLTLALRELAGAWEFDLSPQAGFLLGAYSSGACPRLNTQ